MAARMVNAIPTANTNLAGFGAICSPHCKQSRPLGRIVRAKSAEMCDLLHTSNHRYFDGNNKGSLYQYAQNSDAAMSVALRAVAVKLLLPFHHVCLAAVFLDQLVNVIGPLASAFRTLDAEHVELVFDVAEDEIGPLRHDADSSNGQAAPADRSETPLLPRTQAIVNCCGCTLTPPRPLQRQR